MKISTKHLLLFLLLFSFNLSYAQLNFGVKAGINAAKIDNEVDNYNPIWRIAPNFGIIAEQQLSSKFSLRSGLMYSSKGFALDIPTYYNDKGAKGYDRVMLNYLELPLQLVFHKGRFQVYGGPYAAIALKAKQKWDFTYTDEGNLVSSKGEMDYELLWKENELENTKNSFQAFDCGFYLGVGYELGNFLISTEFSNGFKSISSSVPNHDRFAELPDPWNQLFTLSVTYYFGK